MRKNYLLTVLLGVLMLLPAWAKADVASMTDLFGTYKFTATVEVTDAGKANASKFVTEAETVITKDASNTYESQIQNFAGFAGSEFMKSSKFSVTNSTFTVVNPNGGNYGVVGDALYMANADGQYPFYPTDFSNLTFTFDAATKNITVPDFTIVGDFDWTAGTCKVFACYSNVKLTFVAGESVDIPNISGVWTVTAGSGDYSSKPGSTIPTSYTMTLTGDDSNAKAYKAEIAIEGYQAFTLDATFDGVSLSVGFDNFIVPGTDNVYLINWGNSLKGDFSFTYVNATTMTTDHQLQLGVANPDGGTDNPYTFLQWWMDGSAKKAGSATESFSWDGTYTLHAGNQQVFFNDLASMLVNDVPMVIEKDDTTGDYYLISIMGMDLGALNNGGLLVTPNADNTSAEIALNGGWGNALVTQFDNNGNYIAILDGNGKNNPLTLTYNESTGTFTLSDFYVVAGPYDLSSVQYVALYGDNTLTKTVEEEPIVVDWVGTFTLHADNLNEYVQGFNLSNDVPMVVDEKSGNYYVTSIMGMDLGSLNNGGLRLTLSDDNLSAQISLSGGYGSALIWSSDYTNYLAIVDSKGTTNSLTMTYDASTGKFKLDDFYVVYGPVTSSWAIDLTKMNYIGYYGDNTLTKAETGIADVVVEKVKVIAANGAITLPEAQQVTVVDINGRIIFNGVTDRVEGLAKGLYIVKTAAGAVKVAL